MTRATRKGQAFGRSKQKPTWTGLAMSKPVGKVLDSKVGKKMVGVGNAVIKGAKAMKPDMKKVTDDLFGSPEKDMQNRRTAPRGAYGALSDRERLLGSFKKGGKVKKTGKYKLHKGEVVVPAKKVKKMKKVMKSAKPGDLFNKFAKKK